MLRLFIYLFLYYLDEVGFGNWSVSKRRVTNTIQMKKVLKSELSDDVTL